MFSKLTSLLKKGQTSNNSSPNSPKEIEKKNSLNGFNKDSPDILPRKKSVVKRGSKDNNLSKDISKYEINFENFYKNKECRNIFKEYLIKTHCEASYDFLERINLYKLINTDKDRYIEAKKIIELYIIQFSKNEINISNQVRKDVIKLFEESNETNCTLDLFSNVVMDLMMMLNVDSFKVFQNTLEFQKLCEKDDVFNSFAKLKI